MQDLLGSRGSGDRPRATAGWQGAVRRATGGVVSPQPGKAERSRLDRQKRVQRRLDAPRTIVVLNPKGGAHKTTSTLRWVVDDARRTNPAQDEHGIADFVAQQM